MLEWVKKRLSRDVDSERSQIEKLAIEHFNRGELEIDADFRATTYVIHDFQRAGEWTVDPKERAKTVAKRFTGQRATVYDLRKDEDDKKADRVIVEQAKAYVTKNDEIKNYKARTRCTVEVPADLPAKTIADVVAETDWKRKLGDEKTKKAYEEAGISYAELVGNGPGSMPSRIREANNLYIVGLPAVMQTVVTRMYGAIATNLESLTEEYEGKLKGNIEFQEKDEHGLAFELRFTDDGRLSYFGVDIKDTSGPDGDSGWLAGEGHEYRTVLEVDNIHRPRDLFWFPDKFELADNLKDAIYKAKNPPVEPVQKPKTDSKPAEYKASNVRVY